MGSIKHAFVSTIPDEGTSGKVSPSDWNAAHTIEDNTIAAAKLTTTTQQFLVPSGGIIMWSGSISAIPAGWYLCNGSNGTPDLRDKFIVGARQDEGGLAKTNVSGSLTQSGGAATHTHDEHAGHAHSTGSIAVGISGSTHTHAITGATGIGDGGVHRDDAGAGTNSQNYGHTHSVGTLAVSSGDGTHTHNLSGTSGTNSSGTTSTTHSTASSLGPYFALAYIMKS